MTEQTDSSSKSFRTQRHNTLFWKLFLIYDIFMMLIILVNLFCLCANAFLMSNFGDWIFTTIQLPQVLTYYKTELHPWVVLTESWFITFLIVELIVRWLIAIVNKHHQRWFFFPFIHWYEILAIIPYLRFLRLIRAGVIAYRLHEMGYKIIPKKWLNRLNFYYRVIMEELSDRVVITVIDSIKKEIDTSSTHKKIIHDLVNHHREMLSSTITQILQESLASELKFQREFISNNVGHVVVKAIEDTPELTQLLRLVPIVGSRIEQQIQSIGHRLGKNITNGLLHPFTEGSINTPNPHYQLIAEKVSQINIENKALEQLVESVVYESLESLRKQVAVKQWQSEIQQYHEVKE